MPALLPAPVAHWTRRILATIVVVAVSGCASARRAPLEEFIPRGLSAARGFCSTCNASPLDSAVATALEQRLVDLKTRGGHCSTYAAVLESSYRSGQITMRPFMWRVGPQLASGEAKPNGEMVLAREIDSLNVGVRTLADVLHTMEHEAAHIAFGVSNGLDAEKDRANEYVRACR